MVGNQLIDDYKPSQLARILNRLPHYNGSFHWINSTFRPEQREYMESLGILACVPAALLISTLLVLLVYLVTRCCDRKPRNRLSIILLKCSLAILALVCCAAVAVGLYGNDDVHNGVMTLIASAKHINDSVTGVRDQSKTIEMTLQKVQDSLGSSIKDEFDMHAKNKTLLSSMLASLKYMQLNTSLAVNRSLDIRRQLSSMSLEGFIRVVDRLEQLRWPVTMTILSALLILCVVLLVGVARHSRCALITFSVFGLFAVIISWLMASIYLAGSVALSDLCVGPDEYIKSTANMPLKKQILNYYLTCESSGSNPYTQQLRDGQNAVESIRKNADSLKQMAPVVFDRDTQLPAKLSSLNNEISLIDSKFNTITSSLGCISINTHYDRARWNLCHVGLFGLVLMLLASITSGFFFAVLVWVDSHTWIYIRKRTDYHQVEEQDPFLPPSAAASQATATRTLRSQGSYQPTAPPISSNTHVNHSNKKPLLHSLPPPSYATATARARHLHESMSKGPVVNGREANHKVGDHGAHSLGRDHRTVHHEHNPIPSQYATLSKQCKTLESNDFY